MWLGREIEESVWKLILNQREPRLGRDPRPKATPRDERSNMQRAYPTNAIQSRRSPLHAEIANLCPLYEAPLKKASLMTCYERAR